ncbi:hypothetical protein VTG60DRAFT_1583 [Thermothelomyces hinnuleus]
MSVAYAVCRAQLRANSFCVRVDFCRVWVAAPSRSLVSELDQTVDRACPSGLGTCSVSPSTLQSRDLNAGNANSASKLPRAPRLWDIHRHPQYRHSLASGPYAPVARSRGGARSFGTGKLPFSAVAYRCAMFPGTLPQVPVRQSPRCHHARKFVAVYFPGSFSRSFGGETAKTTWQGLSNWLAATPVAKRPR